MPPGASPTSQLLFTLDGTDPRAAGGGISPNAWRYLGQPLVINTTTRITVRVHDPAGDAFQQWSSPQTQLYNLAVPANASNFRITELHYHPADPTPAELLVVPGATEDDFEFIELQNTGLETISLTNTRFTIGVSFNFSAGTVATLDPGQVTVVVSNLVAFQARYGTGIAVVGWRFQRGRRGRRFRFRDLERE